MLVVIFPGNSFRVALLTCVGFASVTWASEPDPLLSPVAANSSHCQAFERSAYFRETEASIEADPSNWIEKIANAPAGVEVLLADGLYNLDRYAIVFEKPLTLRSASGNRESVIIEGQGYGENAEALMIMADDVHIADITVRNVRDHAISIKEGFARSVIYNVDLIDVGTQHIKGNRMGPDGLIACSRMGYTTDVAPGDYNGAIDLHAAVGWTIRDNYIYNIWGDGSGCLVDEDCGTYYPGGGPAILLWKDSKDNVVERNRIVGSFRGISLGLDTPYSGGVVRDNLVYLDVTGKQGVDAFIEHDTGISLLGADNVVVEGNTVLLPGAYPGPIELQNTQGNLLRNNLVSAPIWNRGNSQYNGCENLTDNDCDSEQYNNLVIASEAAVTADAAGDTSQTQDDQLQVAAIDQPADLPPEDETVEQAPAVDTMADAHTPTSSLQDHTNAVARIERAVNDLVQELSDVVEQARLERIKGAEERLKMKEERLRFIELMLSNRSMGSLGMLLDRQADSSALPGDMALRQRLKNIEALLMQLEAQ
ncbi:MAG: hypothetical protein AAF353_17090 [Pseudomonadota bacterium]